MPNHINPEEAKRVEAYKIQKSIYRGEHFKVFNHDEQEKKINAFEYLCFDIIQLAIQIKTDLIWRQKPKIIFKNEELGKEFEDIRSEIDFDLINEQATINSILHGDGLVGVSIDTDDTIAGERLKVELSLLDVSCWTPLFNSFNLQKNAKADLFKYDKQLEEGGIVTLYTTHSAGNITWEAFVGDQKVSVLKYFQEELKEVLFDINSSDEFKIVYNTNCLFSLVNRLKNGFDSDSYFGVSDLNLPVISKLNALNNYANLADVIIVTNTFPKLILSEEAELMLKRIIDGYNRERTEDTTDMDINLLDTPKGSFLSSQSYASSYIYRKLLKEMRAFVDGGSGGETKYLINDFDLSQLREQFNILFKSIMSELGIAEVFYDSTLTTGALSGTAYKRLASKTLNEVDKIKRHLEKFLARQVYTICELANKNGIFRSTPEMPTVQFDTGLIVDEKEIVDLVVQKYQNKLLPTIEAIKQANLVDEETAENYKEEIDSETNADIDNSEEINQELGIQQVDADTNS